MRSIVVALGLVACGAHTGQDRADSGNGSGRDSGFAQCDPNVGLACSANNVVDCNPDGTFGAVQQMCGNGMMCTGGVCTNSCTADGVDLVYVVDEANDFMSFDPRKLPNN